MMIFTTYRHYLFLPLSTTSRPYESSSPGRWLTFAGPVASTVAAAAAVVVVGIASCV